MMKTNFIWEHKTTKSTDQQQTNLLTVQQPQNNNTSKKLNILEPFFNTWVKCKMFRKDTCDFTSAYLEKSVSGSSLFMAWRRLWNLSSALTKIVLSPVSFCEKQIIINCSKSVSKHSIKSLPLHNPHCLELKFALWIINALQWHPENWKFEVSW